MSNSLFALLVISGMFFSCEEQKDFLVQTKAESNILFPDYPGYSASFTTFDNVDLKVKVDGSASSLSVKNNAGKDYGKVAIAGNKGAFSKSLSSMGDSTQVLLFSDSKSSRRFSVTAKKAASWIKNNSETVYLDSTYQIGVEANTVNGKVEKVEIFTKKGKLAKFGTTAAKTFTPNSLKVKDSATFTAKKADWAIGDTIYYQVKVSSGSLSETLNKVDKKPASIVVKAIPLTEKGDVELNPKNAFNFASLAKVDDKTMAKNPEKVDVKLEVTAAGLLNLVTDSNSKTQFVVVNASSLSKFKSYEAVRDKFTAGTKVSAINNIASLKSDNVYLVKIGNVPVANGEVVDNRSYAAFTVSSFKNLGADKSTVTISYWAPKQPKKKEKEKKK